MHSTLYAEDMTQVATPGPLLLDAVSLLAEVADDLVVKTVRDTHLTALDRVASVTRSRGSIHPGIAAPVYGSLILAGAVALLPNYGAPSFLAYCAALTLVLVAICWIKGERPQWRWPRK